MNDQCQVAEAGIHSAIVVDDSYDVVHQINELRDKAGLDNFSDDVQAGQEDGITAF